MISTRIMGAVCVRVCVCGMQTNAMIPPLHCARFVRETRTGGLRGVCA